MATAPSPDTSGTSLIVQTGDGAKFPTGSFNVAAWPAGQLPLLSNAEIMRCTVAGDTFTLTRAQEGTSAQPIVIGFQIAQMITAALFAEILANPVTTFNTRNGAVTLEKSDVIGTGLTYSDVNADEAGSAATAQSNAETYALAAARAMWPIGSIFLGAVSTNPNTLLGFGTWSAIAPGRAIVGVGLGTDTRGVQENIVAGDNVANLLLQEYYHTLLSGESGLPDHEQYEAGGGDFLSSYGAGASGYTGAAYGVGANWANPSTGGVVGGAQNAANSHNNIQPLFGVYVWQRTA